MSSLFEEAPDTIAQLLSDSGYNIGVLDGLYAAYKDAGYTGSLEDRVFAALTQAGYTGTLTNMWNQAFNSDGTLGISLIVDLLNPLVIADRDEVGTFLGYASDAVLADGKTPLTASANEPRMANARRATTVVDGAELGEELYVGGETWTSNVAVTTVDNTHTCNFAGFGSVSNVNGTISTTPGHTYEVTGEILSSSAGSLLVYVGNGANVAVSSIGIFTLELVAGSLQTAINFGSTDFAGVVRFDTLKQVIPTYYDTDADGVLIPDVKSEVDDAVTNKCAVVKANPVDTTGLTLGGDVAATLTVVDDSVELSLAGLGVICSSGKVYKLDNSGGAGLAFAIVSGTTGSTNPHSVQAYARVVSSTGQLTNSGGSPKTEILGVSYSSYTSNGFTPLDSGIRLAVFADAGSVVYFILPGLYESSTVPASSPVISDPDTAAAASSIADKLSIPTPSVLKAASGAIKVEYSLHETGQSAAILHWSGCTVSLTPTTIQAVFSSGESLSVANTQTTDLPVTLDVFWDSDYKGLRVNSDPFAIAVSAGDITMDATLQLGQEDGINIIKGSYS